MYSHQSKLLSTLIVRRHGQTLRQSSSCPHNALTESNPPQITHSEWASEDAYSASAGSGVSKAREADTTFKRLPFNFCSISLQPFQSPVCTSEGTVFDVENILPWLEKHGTDPVSGKPLKAEDLIRLNFTKNDEGEYVDPVTFKIFTNNTHIVALKNTGNVFAYDTVERLNVKAKMWRDLVNDEEFSRKDIITLQDPQNIQSRNLNSFKYIKDGVSTLTPEQERQRSAGVNASALGNASVILKGKEEPQAHSKPKVGKYLQQSSDEKAATGTNGTIAKSSSSTMPPPTKPSASSVRQTSHHTTGRAAASFTSTGLTPDTSNALATLTDEEYLLRPRRVKASGFVRLEIPPHGTLTLELLPEHAPRAVWNFIQLTKKGYYNDGVVFHRNIRHFMLQGGDPTGTGRGGSSVWGGVFPDEFEGPLSHDRRGMISMANKGKDTNTSQFFITYAPCKHLDRKHTIFGRVADGWETLDRVEKVEVSAKDKRPLEDLAMADVTVLVDPFEDFLRTRDEQSQRETEEELIRRSGGRDEDKTTWTGKRVRGDDTAAAPPPAVGKYLAARNGGSALGQGKATDGGGGAEEEETLMEEWEAAQEPVKKKVKAGGGFGNFDNW